MSDDDYDFREAAERAEMFEDEMRAEIARLKAELREAHEIIQQQLGFPFGSAERARAFLDKAGK